MNQPQRPIRIDHWIVAILLFAMAAIAFLNVVSRYLFHFSFAATEEITINLFVWITVIGSGIAFERGGQLGMVTLYNTFPDRYKRWAVVLSALLSAFLFVLVDLFTIQAIYDELAVFGASSAALGIPVWIYYVGVPVFSVFVFQGIFRHATAQLRELDPGGRG
ncbi:MAG: TRAP transporter small permease [Candidatus Latescibacteria bacterium]|nr:TRAP transporter small permease [Candidatus Latescibacterota bacterium]